MKYKILITFLMLFLFLPFISSWEFDNVKRYNEETKTITVVNALGLGDDIATIQLKTPLNNKVGYGAYVKVAEFEVHSFNIYGNAFKELELFDKRKGDAKFTRDYDYKRLDIEEVIVEDFGNVNVGTSLNGSTIWERQVTGNHTEQEEVWTRLTQADFRKDEVVTVGLFTFVEKDDFVEWIPNFFGIRINEWATWDAGLEVGMNFWWTLNETSGTNAPDMRSNNDGTYTGGLPLAVTGVSNITNNAQNSTLAGTYISDPNNPTIDDTTGSISVWIKPNVLSNNNVIVASGQEASSGTPYFYLGFSSATGFLETSANDGTNNLERVNSSSGFEIPTNDTWYHIVVTNSGTNNSFYINGILQVSSVISGAGGKWFGDMSGIDAFAVGILDRATNVVPFNGSIDEVTTFNRSISQSEIDTLFNNGLGCTFGLCDTPTTPPAVTLNSPIPAFNSTTTSLTFNTTVTDDSGITNVSLYVNGIINQTNTSTINGTYIFTALVGEGSHNWSILAFNNANASNQSTTRTFFVDTSPIINVLSPLNQTYIISTIFFNATNSQTVGAWIVNYNGTNTTLTDINTTLEVEDGLNFNLLLYANNSVTGALSVNDSIVFSVDANPPLVTITQPNSTVIPFHAINTNLQVNWTVSDAVAGLDTCIVEYNGVNSTITCANNGTLINITEYNNKTLTLYVNDTFGNQNTSSTTWEYRLFETIETFDATVLEGQLTTFKLELLTNGSTITLTNLSYNGTENFGAITNNGGNNFSISKTITVPTVSADTNIPFHWIITQGGFTYDYSSQNQTVQDLSIDDCSLNTNVLYNFTIVDEGSQGLLVPGTENTTGQVELKLFGYSSTTLIQQFNKTYSKINPFAICINNTFSTANYNVDVLIRYDATIYETEFYNIQNDTINSSSFTTNITLFDLITSDSQIFEIIVKDTSFLAIKDALIEVQRKYISNGTFKIVEIPKTDENGEAVAHLVVQDVIYNFIIKKFGVTIREFNNVIPVCQNPTITTCLLNFNAFTTAIVIPDFEAGEDFNFTLGFNSSTRVISSVFVIPSGTAAYVTLNVTREDALGTAVCSDFITSTGATLSCVVPSSFGNSTIRAELYRAGNLQAFGQVKLDQDPSDIFGTALVILGILVFITLLGAGLSDNPIYTIIFLMVGVVVLFALNLVANNGFIGGTATILFLVIAIIIVIINARRSR